MVSKQLKQIALDHGTTVQAVLTEAMKDLFIKYKRNPIA
ncbi:ribbon-helix-helix domain-containing protein [Chrysosporum bergii]